MAIYNKVETTNVSGRCFSFVSDMGVENGSLVAMGELVEGTNDTYKGEIPAIGNKVFLVANPAWSYDDCRTVNQNEENYINKADLAYRVYELKELDKFTVEDYGISDNTTLAVGDYVTVDGTTAVIKDVGTAAPADIYGFVGRVERIETYGFAFCTGTAGNVGSTGKKVTIKVIKNENV